MLCCPFSSVTPLPNCLGCSVPGGCYTTLGEPLLRRHSCGPPDTNVGRRAAQAHLRGCAPVWCGAVLRGACWLKEWQGFPANVWGGSRTPPLPLTPPWLIRTPPVLAPFSHFRDHGSWKRAFLSAPTIPMKILDKLLLRTGVGFPPSPRMQDSHTVLALCSEAGSLYVVTHDSSGGTECIFDCMISFGCSILCHCIK